MDAAVGGLRYEGCVGHAPQSMLDIFPTGPVRVRKVPVLASEEFPVLGNALVDLVLENLAPALVPS